MTVASRDFELKSKHVTIVIALFFVLNLGFMLFLADRDGYEGDDLNSILPMLHLEAAKHGDLLIYRYAWQPLAYELGSLIFRVFKTPSAIFALAPIFGAVALVILLVIIWRNKRSTISLANSLIGLFAVPELWFTSLYFNSTVLGLPFLAGCWALLTPKATRPTQLFAGCLLGVAALMRLEFILAAPLLALIAYKKSGTLSSTVYLAVGTIIALVTASSAGILDVPAAIDVYKSSSKELAEKASLPGWDLRAKLGTLSVLISPVGWIALALGAPSLALRYLRQDRMQTILLLFAMAFLSLPLLNLLSVKYAIPFLIFCAYLISSCLSEIGTWRSRWSGRLPVGLLGTATIVLAFISVNISGAFPFFHIGASPVITIPTHDGSRSYGGYLWQMGKVDRFAERSSNQRAANEIAEDFLRMDGANIVILGGESFFDVGAIGWRHLQLRLEREGLRGVLIAPHAIRFSLGQRLLTLRLAPADGTFSTDIKLYDLRS